MVTKTIVINPSITASIGYDRNYICKPGDINFKASGSGNINTYSWDFGDGSGIVTVNTNTITHNFAAPGSYNINLLATAASGCFDSNKLLLKCSRLPSMEQVSPTTGCIPATVTFNCKCNHSR